MTFYVTQSLVVFWISMNCNVKYYKLKPIAQRCCYQQRNEKKFVKCQFPICKLFYQSVKSFILLWWKMHFITSYPILGTTFLTNKSTLHWLQRNAKCAYKVQVFWKGHKNWKKISHLFWYHWVNVKKCVRFFQIIRPSYNI